MSEWTNAKPVDQVAEEIAWQERKRGAGMNDDAIREAAEAALLPGLCEWHGMKPYANCDTCSSIADGRKRDAARVIDAVRPLIEAQLRERLAAAIETAAELPGAHEFYGTVAEGLHAAARIVRVTP